MVNTKHSHTEFPSPLTHNIASNSLACILAKYCNMSKNSLRKTEYCMHGETPKAQFLIF